MNFKFVFLFLIVIFSFSLVSAKFVCGEVADSEDKMLASWFDVRVFYLSGEETYCKVSPDENKYCCDLEDAKSSWSSGDQIFSEILSEKYFAKNVTLIVSNSSYDVFPLLQLEKAITIYSPEDSFFVGDFNYTFLNLSFKEPYTNIFIEGEEVCTNCLEYSDNISIDYGMNKIQIISKKDSVEFKEDIEFGVVKNFEIVKDVSCEGCKNNKINRNKTVEFSIKLNLSHEVENLYFKEYIPHDWQILDSNGGEIYYSNSKYNFIQWPLNGSNLSISYKVISPSIGEKTYSFSSAIDNFILSENNYKLFNSVPFIIPKSSSSRRSYSSSRGTSWSRESLQDLSSSKYSYSSPTSSLLQKDLPLIVEEGPITVALYSNSSGYSYLNLSLIDKYDEKISRDLKFLKGYAIETELGLDNFSKFYFEFNLSDENLEEVEFFGVNSKGKLSPLTGRVVSSDYGDSKYIFSSDEFFRNILIYKVDERNFIRKYLDFFNRFSFLKDRFNFFKKVGRKN